MKINLILMILGMSLCLSFSVFCSCKVNLRENDNSKQESNAYKAQKVIDGDTIELSNGTVVRYVGINTPERNQAFYEASVRFNENMVKHQNLRMEYDRNLNDQYGRSLAYVFVGNQFINLEMLKAGLAFAYSDPHNTKYAKIFRDAQNQAQSMELGMWKKSPYKIGIHEIQYDAPGNDEENLNGEWVELINEDSVTISLKGFMLHDESNHQFIFPAFELLPTHTVKIYSGKGTRDSISLYWGSKNPIWNNQGDSVFLFDNDQRFLDMQRWSKDESVGRKE